MERPRRAPKSVTRLSCPKDPRPRTLGRFRSLARLSLHAGLMASGCVLSDPPEYGTVKQTPPFLQLDTADPSPFLLATANTNEIVTMSLDVRSEDAGDGLKAVLYRNYDPTRAQNEELLTRDLAPSTLENTRTFSLTWLQQAAACVQLTVMVTHSENLTTNNEIRDPRDVAYAT